jgi:MSHA pilin protein MshA
MKTLTNNGFKQQKGFTLIELVIVIVILGILAATAAPKFIDLTGDARRAVMQGVQGSINSAVTMVHAKALVDGETAATGQVTINNVNYTLVHGYPAAEAVAGSGATSGAGIKDIIDLETGTKIAFSSASPTVVSHTGTPAANAATCTLTYTNATATVPPTLVAVLTSC